MFDYLRNFAADRRNQDVRLLSNPKAAHWAQARLEQGFFGRIAGEINRSQHYPLPPDHQALFLSCPTHIMSPVAAAVCGKRGKGARPSTPEQRYLDSIHHNGDKPACFIHDPGAISLALLVHSTTSIGYDGIALACSIGAAALGAAALGEQGLPVEVVLAGGNWQAENNSVQIIKRQNFTLDGKKITPDDFANGFARSVLQRTALYQSVGHQVNFQDLGITIDSGPLDDMVNHYYGRCLELAGKVLTDEQRLDPTVAFLEHLANSSGRKDSNMPILDANRLKYYILQALIQSPYLKTRGGVIKFAPSTEAAFDASHKFELEPWHWYPGWPGTQGHLHTYYRPHYQVGYKKVLPYNWLSLDVIAAAQRLRGEDRDLTRLMLDTIPLGDTRQTVKDIAALLKPTPPEHLNQLMSELIGFLMLCQRHQSASLADACSQAHLMGGIDGLLSELGGDPLVYGWHEGVKLSPGKATRDSWVNYFNSLDPKHDSRTEAVPPHLWFGFQSHYPHDWQYLLLAQLVDVTRQYYLAVKAA